MLAPSMVGLHLRDAALSRKGSIKSPAATTGPAPAEAPLRLLPAHSLERQERCVLPASVKHKKAIDAALKG